MSSGPLCALDPSSYREIVRRALAEDACRDDVTTAATIPAAQRATGDLIANGACVLAGVDVAVEAFVQLDPGAEVDRRRRDGDCCAAGELIFRITGSAAALLSAERTALNFLQRMSGTATLTRRFVDAAAGRAAIFDTRKTTPTLRVLEKHAVRAGGGASHRAALDDGILIKDNHIRIAGSVTEAVRRGRTAGRGLPVEVEAQSLGEVDEAVAAAADIILLDNLSLADVRTAVDRIAGRARVEVSGGVTLERVAELAATGADRISVGALTHSAPAVDCSFDLRPTAPAGAAAPAGPTGA